MEQPGAHVVRPASDDGTNNPKHLIIWLDKHIGKSGECALLKRAFFMTTDPTTGYDVSLHGEDIDNSIRLGDAVPVRLDGIQFVLRAFEDPSTCYEAIKNNLDKRIFLITSGAKGAIIVPCVLADFPKTFVPEYWIYVFCAKMNMISTPGAGEPTNDWAFDYEDHVVMYNHQDDLLARLVLDIAIDFFTEADRLGQTQQLDNAYRHYGWSKKMYTRYEKMVEKPNLMKGKITEIERRISVIEQQLAKQKTSDGESISKPCD